MAGTTAEVTLGRRERNKQAKLERIVAAASELFAEHGVDDVTTQQIADRADIGSGTLFLYAKTKGELLLLVQNAHYAEALERGTLAASTMTNTLDAVMSVVRPVIECNRVQVDNGRTYLREMAFGDPTEPHHAQALTIVAQTEATLASIVERDKRTTPEAASTLARVISAIMFLTMAASVNTLLSIDDIEAEIRRQVALILP